MKSDCDPRFRPRFRCARPGAWPVLAALAAASAAGCGEPKQKYHAEPQDAPTPLRASDMGVSDETFARPGVWIADAGETQGRFPAGLSIVRVVPAERTADALRVLHVEPTLAEREAYWNDFMDELPAIREVTPLRTIGIDPRGVDPEVFLRESMNVECELCLMYAVATDTEADAEMAAVLWDVRSRSVLAMFRSPATLPPEEREKCLKHGHPADRLCEAEFRAEVELRRLVRDALWDMSKRDVPGTTTQPSPWREGSPLLPRDLRTFWFLNPQRR